VGASITIRHATGTITAIRQVRVADCALKFAMVTCADRTSRWAIRLPTLQEAACFEVGDEVRYTLISEPSGEPARAQDLVRLQPAGPTPPQVFEESLIASAKS
jgi:hypothetical protein